MLKNPEQTIERVCTWIKDYVDAVSPKAKVVIGISGGKDSSTAAALCVRALGRERVIGVTMPDGVQPDIEDSNLLISHLQIQHLEVNISAYTNAFAATFSANEGFAQLTGSDELSKDAKINYPARMRMVTLYAIAQSLPGGALVVNTCNRSEDYVGYSTKFGDAAGDFSPMAGFMVHEVLQLGEVLGLPRNLVHKVPSDGLSGLSDEDKLGFTYAMLDHYIETGECSDGEKKAKIDRLHKINLHKLNPMPCYHKNEVED